MSKLQDLIQEFCPDGVEVRELKEITEMKRGSSITKSKSQSGIYPVISGGKLPAFYCDQFNRTGETITVAGSGSAGYVQYWNQPIFVNDAFSIKAKDQILTKFLYYTLSKLQEQIYKTQKVGGVPHVYISSIEKFPITLPPLPVQAEIVRILDTFTALIDELKDLLKRELVARKKQYEYYRDKLLTFGEDVPRKTLGEIATNIFRGNGITRSQLTDSGIPCVRYGDIYTKYGIWFDKCQSYTDPANISNKKYFGYGDILFAITGESVNDIAKSSAYVGHEKCLAGGDLVVLQHNQNPKYLSYALSTYEAIKQKTKGKSKNKVVHSSVPDIKKIVIPLPPLSEQERIVSILDRFDALCTDLCIGIPAEIKARQKQYEYYREQLLTFKIKT